MSKKKNQITANKKRLMRYDTSSGTVVQKTTLKKQIANKAIIYCRVSDKKQMTEGHWLEGQERFCIERCQKQNPPIEVIKVYKEPGVSWATIQRKELGNLLEYLKHENRTYSKITHFVVSEASRISRPENIAEAFMLEAKIKSFGVEIVKLDSPWIDETTDEGHLFKTIQYAVAWYERKKIAKRAFNGRRNRMLNGYRPFPRPPLWYKRIRHSKKEYTDVPDEVRSEILKTGLESFADNIIHRQSDLGRSNFFWWS